MKTISDIISFCKKDIIQIATPYYTGTGFCYFGYDYLITNQHVVADNQTVVVRGQDNIPVQVEVVYTDEVYDIAFLTKPDTCSNKGLKAGSSIHEYEAGYPVIAMGHPFGLPFSVTKGVVSALTEKEKGIFYIQHDAALNPGNSGGPLLNEQGEVIGVNTFTILNGQNIGFALPVSVVEVILKEFLVGGGRKAVRCSSCRSINFEIENQPAVQQCSTCGASVKPISLIVPFQPQGVSRVLEEILISLGFQLNLIRKGPDHWILTRGSATIEISYHEKTGLISAEAYVCRLPDLQIAELYKYILEQNNLPGALTYSIKEDTVLLSFLIYDHFMHGGLIGKYFEHLFKCADEADEILIHQFGALPVFFQNELKE